MKLLGIPVTDIALILTLFVVLWYTIETHKLRLQSEKHLGLSYMPYLQLILKRGGLYLYNIGNGPAVDVEIEDKIVSPVKYPMRLRFICPPIIKKGECLPIEVKILTEDGQHEDSSTQIEFLKPPDATETYEVEVRFFSLVGDDYTYPQKLGKSMPNDSTPADYLLQYLFAKSPKTIEPNEIPAHYVAESERLKVLYYCLGKGFINATLIGYDQPGNEKFQRVLIKSQGIDYLKGKI